MRTRKGQPQIFTAINAQNVPVSPDVLDILNKQEMQEALLRKCIRNLLIEARTPRFQDLSPAQMVKVIDTFISAEDQGVSFTEKFAGQHLDVEIQKNGEVLTRSKQQRARNLAYTPASSHLNVATALENHHPSVTEPVSYMLEIIRPDNRPDYISYAVGNKTYAIEYTGTLTASTANQLNDNQQNVVFLSKSEIQRATTGVDDEVLQNLVQMKEKLSAGKVNKKQSAEMGEYLSGLIHMAFGGSTIGGGPMEGLFGSVEGQQFKIPTSEYAEIQRVQSQIYAVFTGRAGPKREIRQRFLDAAGDSYLLENDRLINNVLDYLEFARQEHPSGFRTFFSPDEADTLINTAIDMESGSTDAAVDIYEEFNQRLNDRNSWHTTV